MKEIKAAENDAPDIFTTTCVIQSFSDLFYYTGCQYCKKKILSTENVGECAACHKQYKELPYTYMFSVLITDGTERCWVQVIGDFGEIMLGIKAKELAEWQKSGKTQHSHPRIQNILYKRLTLGLKKKKDAEGNHKLFIDKMVPPGYGEQNFGFLKRLELYESYIMN